jgi:hypothetical protein
MQRCPTTSKDIVTTQVELGALGVEYGDAFLLVLNINTWHGRCPLTFQSDDAFARIVGERCSSHPV